MSRTTFSGPRTEFPSTRVFFSEKGQVYLTQFSKNIISSLCRLDCRFVNKKKFSYKKLLQHERKRHTARHVASAHYAALSPDEGGGVRHLVLDRGVPHPADRTVPLSFLMGGTPGYTPCPDLDRGTPCQLDGVPPPTRPGMGYSPPPNPDPRWAPSPKVGQTHLSKYNLPSYYVRGR